MEVVGRPTRIVALLTGLVGFLLMTAAVQGGITEAPDMAALAWTSTLHGGPLDIPMLVISEFGGSMALSFASLFAISMLSFSGRWSSATFLALAFVVSGLVSGLSKALVGRARPPDGYRLPMDMPATEAFVWLALAVVIVITAWRTRWRAAAVIGAGLFALSFFIEPSSVSVSIPGLDAFPSGHATRSVVVFAALAYVLPELRGRRTLITLLVVLVLIGVSRVYLGVHHPSDVVAGWFVGTALVSALSFVLRDVKPIREGRQLQDPRTALARPEGFEPPTY